MLSDEDAQQDKNFEFRPQYQNLFSPERSMEVPNLQMGDKALRMMQKMGYKPGSGLGKNEQGISESINVNVNLGKRGLGLKINNLNLSDDGWDFAQEDILVQEKVEWLENFSEDFFPEQELEKWTKEGPPDQDVIGSSKFCDIDVVKNVFKGKDIFDQLPLLELNQARVKANPFESVRSVFFMNRAALKMANLDAATDFMFTNVENSEYFKHEKGPIYFADVCAGPGGFTEYILWRKKWFYKGFGLTLKDAHDFKVSESTCASGVSFQALYGLNEDGDVCNPSNLLDFTERVKNETDFQGVHFMMSDGGFCVDGKENLQEILSKNIYICQCLLALYILRPNGMFVTKLFDVFTPFSVGLLYLMYLSFDKVGIIKPNSSRPANSERYFVCKHFKLNKRTNIIREYMWNVIIRLWELRVLPDRDILEIVPLHVITKDESFFRYIVQSNNKIGKNQIIALKKLGQFCRNPSLIDVRQEQLRTQCLTYWKIPDEKKKSPEICKVEHVLSQLSLAPEILRIQTGRIDSDVQLHSTVFNVNDWHYAYMFSSADFNRTNFYAGIRNSKVYRFQNNKWLKVNNIELVQGTLLFGEFVKETIILDSDQVQNRYSLHVIDAVYLGSKDLQGMTFKERAELIQIYCKSVNRESQSKYSVRIRPKPLTELSNLPQDYSLMGNEGSENALVNLPRLGYKSLYEQFQVNSMLLLKTNNSQTFQSTHIFRIQIFNTKVEDYIGSISFEELKKYVQDKLYV